MNVVSGFLTKKVTLEANEGSSVSFFTGVVALERPHFTMQYGSAPGVREVINMCNTVES